MFDTWNESQIAERTLDDANTDPADLFEAWDAYLAGVLPVELTHGAEAE